MDARQLEYDGEIDCIIDKGCLDSVLVFYSLYSSVVNTLMSIFTNYWIQSISLYLRKESIFVSLMDIQQSEKTISKPTIYGLLDITKSINQMYRMTLQLMKLMKTIIIIFMFVEKEHSNKEVN